MRKGEKKKNNNNHYWGQYLFTFIYPNESVSKRDIREAVSSMFCKAQSSLAYDNTRCCISKHRSPVIPNPWWFCLFPFVLKCLHGQSLVVVVISSCFCMKLQSKCASVCLLKQLSVVYTGGKKCPSKTCQTLFFVVWNLVLDTRMYLECFDVLAYSFSCHLRG